MPLYEYRCTQCGHRFEKIQTFGSNPLTECPNCKGTLERPLTAPALQFKGAGWYVNDYAGKAKSSSADSSSPDKPAAEKPSAAPSADAKPAASESKPASSQSSSGSAPASGSTSSSATA